MTPQDFTQFHPYILRAEAAGLVTRTYRRLDPERQQAVFQAILDEAAQRGPADLSVKSVAQRAGVSVGSLYQYFGDRDRMLDFAVELCVWYVTELFRQYQPYLAAMPLREALAAYLTGGIEWSREEVGLIQLFARAAYQGDPQLSERLVTPIANALREMVGAILAAAEERGELRARLDLESVTRIVHALMIAAGDSQLLPYLNHYFQVIDPTQPSERLLEALIDFILYGLAAPPEMERGDSNDG
jgi:AcrR family transcriptional regulator